MNTLLWPFIHFAALLGFIVYKTKAPFGQFIRTRHQEVLTGLNKSKLQAAEAAQRKAEIERKLTGLEAEKQAILAEFKEREVEQIRALRESSQRILAQIKVDAQLNRKSLEEGFRVETLRAFSLLVIKKAEQKLKSAMSPESHKKVNEEFVKELMGA
jgi:F0F1-type ATP synthase membrane subunit b/b'